MLVLGLAEVVTGQNPPVPADVPDLHALGEQDPAHQQVAMALRRVFFAAHDGNPRLQRQGFNLGERAAESRRPGDHSVLGMATGIVELLPVWLPPQLGPQENVLEAGQLNSRSEL